MKITDLATLLQLELCAGSLAIEKEVNNVYVCDLLSNVMSHAGEDDIWITIQTHQNIVAVASLLNIPAIIIPEGFKPDLEAVKKAETEGIAIFSCDLSAYTLCGKLFQLLNKTGV